MRIDSESLVRKLTVFVQFHWYWCIYEAHSILIRHLPISEWLHQWGGAAGRGAVVRGSRTLVDGLMETGLRSFVWGCQPL